MSADTPRSSSSIGNMLACLPDQAETLRDAFIGIAQKWEAEGVPGETIASAMLTAATALCHAVEFDFRTVEAGIREMWREMDEAPDAKP